MMIRLLENKPSAAQVARSLKAWIKTTRFRFGWYQGVEAYPYPAAGTRFKGGWASIYSVRLRECKFYHGNGPDNRGTMTRRGWQPGKKPIKVSFLEGADWVEFNDLLNDFLDARNISADVQSRAAVIRKGRRRRIRYTAAWIPSRWNKEETVWGWSIRGEPTDFQDCTKQNIVPFSEFPAKAPGFYRNLHAHLINVAA